MGLRFLTNIYNNSSDGPLSNLQLDIVGFLAVLGEGSVLANAQVGALSRWSYLPRLLPAPQALIRNSRPERLEESTGKVVGAHSGVIRDKLNHVAHILHSGNALAEYEVRCCTLSREDGGRTEVRASAEGPLTWLSILGCCMSFTLGGLSIWQDDGMSLLATILLSLLSTIIGIGSKWTLELPARMSKREVPPGDVVICYPHGAFMIIKCEERIAKELYWAPEKCNYMVNEHVYRLVALTGTILLMFGVIFLANASINLQIAYAVSYIIINAAYWVVAALPQRLHWELSAFKENIEKYEPCRDFGHHSPNFTKALWQAIAITRTTHWVRIANVAPQHRAWDMWLAQAEREVKNYSYEEKKADAQRRYLLPDWNCQDALTKCMEAAAAERQSV